MDDFTIQLTAENLKFVPIIITLIQLAKQNKFLSQYAEWYTLITLMMGVFFVSLSLGWIMNANVFIDGLSVGVLACGSYDVVKRVAPKIINQQSDTTLPPQ